MGDFHVLNIEALIHSVNGCRTDQIGLGCIPIDGPAVGRYRPCELVAFIPHFRALGVVPPPRPGLAGMRLPDGRTRDPVATLEHLFGRFGAYAPTAVLTPDFGKGRWDKVLISWFPTPPTDKELALARLLYAREAARGAAVADAPGPLPPARVSQALGLPADYSPAARYLSNLRVLTSAAAALRRRRLFLTPFEDGWKRRLCVADLVASRVFFQAQGVLKGQRGMPVMRRSDGSLVGTKDTLNHLFGTYDGWTAYEALFVRLADGCWDYRLLATFPGCPEEHQVALARLRHAWRFALSQVADAPRLRGRVDAQLVGVV